MEPEIDCRLQCNFVRTMCASLLVLCTVLAVGGLVQAQSGDPYANAPGRWRATGDLVTARSYHTATLLLNGEVLAAGGNGGGASAELYDPATGVWTATGSMVTARESHTATLLLNGQVLVAGGTGNL